VTTKEKLERAVALTQAEGRHLTATFEDVRKYICPKASDAEIGLFLKTCSSEGLNPFAREIYLVKYAEDQPAAIVIGFVEQVDWLDRGAELPLRSQVSKVREAQVMKVPYMVILGDREVEARQVTARLRSGENLPAMPVEELVSRLAAENHPGAERGRQERPQAPDAKV